MGFFGNYKRLLELSVNNQKMDDEENPTPTYGEEDDAGADPAADTPATEEPPAEDPAPANDPEPTPDDTADDGEDPYAIPADDEGGEPAPESEPAPAAEEPPAEGGEEPADDYNIPDDAEPAANDGEDPYAIPSDDEGAEEPPADDTTGTVTDDSEAAGGEDDGGDPYAIPGEGEGDDAGTEGGEGAEGTVGDETGEDGGEGEVGDDTGSAIANDLKSMEDEIFADLSDQQKDIRDNELKQNYIDLYGTIDDAEKRINNIVKDERTGRVLEFITRKMSELKNLIHHNLTKVFNTRTYIENQTALSQCIAIMNTICDMLDSIAKDDDHKDEDDD